MKEEGGRAKANPMQGLNAQEDEVRRPPLIGGLASFVDK
jgi:hypothetical protein